jgi:hypothetical protein
MSFFPLFKLKFACEIRRFHGDNDGDDILCYGTVDPSTDATRRQNPEDHRH